MAGRRKQATLGVPISSSLEPDLSEPHKQAVLTSLRWAWGELHRTKPGLTSRANEETITEGLERLLNAYEGGQRRARWLDSFSAVTRGSKVRAGDGRIEKQPDLHFRPIPYRSVRCASDWAWFVECKIVDGAASLRLYRIEGIERFVTGEYAARMPSAAMIGYCRDGTAPLDILRIQLGTVSVDAGHLADECSSVHFRHDPPGGTIDISHLWLGSEP